jgi:ribosomal protein L11 methylase PrmA
LRNGVGGRVGIFRGDAAQYAQVFRQCGRARRHCGFDLIVCNMLIENMRPLLEHFRDLVRRGHSATVITSGHLWAERREALEALKPAGIHVAYGRKMGD